MIGAKGAKSATGANGAISAIDAKGAPIALVPPVAPIARIAPVAPLALVSIQSRELQNDLRHPRIIFFRGAGSHPGVDLLLCDGEDWAGHLIFAEGG